MVVAHGRMEDDFREGRPMDYLRSARTAEKYMNTDAVDVEDRAAGRTRMPLLHL